VGAGGAQGLAGGAKKKKKKKKKKKNVGRRQGQVWSTISGSLLRTIGLREADNKVESRQYDKGEWGTKFVLTRRETECSPGGEGGNWGRFTIKLRI